MVSVLGKVCSRSMKSSAADRLEREGDPDRDLAVDGAFLAWKVAMMAVAMPEVLTIGPPRA